MRIIIYIFMIVACCSIAYSQDLELTVDSVVCKDFGSGTSYTTIAKYSPLAKTPVRMDTAKMKKQLYDPFGEEHSPNHEIVH